MNANVIFANSFGEYFLYGWLLPVVGSVILTAIFCGVVWCIFKAYRFLEKIKYYIDWRWNISKLVRLIGEPVEETTYYPNGKTKTRRYYF